MASTLHDVAPARGCQRGDAGVFARALRRHLLGVVVLSGVVGCTTEENHYVGTWHDGEQFLRIDGNGLGDGSVFRKRGKRSCSWVTRGDRIIVTFGEPPRSDVVEARIEADGNLRVWSGKQSVTLRRGPLSFDEPAEVEEPWPGLDGNDGSGIGELHQLPPESPSRGWSKPS